MSRDYDLHLISFDICPYVERSRIVLEEKEVDYDLTFIDLSDKPDWFLEISPRGKVPVLKVDDEPIFESTVINEMLEELYPEPALMPDDPVARAKTRQWTVFANDEVMAHQSTMWFNKDDDAKVEEARGKLRNGFEKVESLLGQRESGSFFFGEKFSLVDAIFAPIFTRWEFTEKLGHGDLLEDFPRLRDYKDALLARDSVQTAKDDNLTQKLLDY